MASFLIVLATPYILLVVIPLSLYGWYELIQKSRKDASLRREVAARFPVARWQFRISDLWVGSFVFGCVMMVFLAWLGLAHLQQSAPLCACVVMAETGAFLIAMDACRRSETLQRFMPRTLYTVLLMFVAGVLPLFPILILAWTAWRYAQWKTLAAKLSFEKRQVWLKERVAARKAKLEAHG